MRLLQFLNEILNSKVQIIYWKQLKTNNYFEGKFEVENIIWRCEINRVFGNCLYIAYCRDKDNEFKRQFDFKKYFGKVFSGVATCVEKILDFFEPINPNLIDTLIFETDDSELFKIYKLESIQKRILNRFQNFYFIKPEEKFKNGKTIWTFTFKKK